MNATILIVDDEEQIRAMLSRRFRFIGHDVLLASNGKEALSVLEENRVDIVISDIMMPKMDGVELLEKIQYDYPMIKTIMITGYVTLENALACMRRRAQTIVFKPFEDLIELEEAVQEAISSLRRWQDKLMQLRSVKPDGGIA